MLFSALVLSSFFSSVNNVFMIEQNNVMLNIAWASVLAGNCMFWTSTFYLWNSIFFLVGRIVQRFCEKVFIQCARDSRERNTVCGCLSSLNTRSLSFPTVTIPFVSSNDKLGKKRSNMQQTHWCSVRIMCQYHLLMVSNVMFNIFYAIFNRSLQWVWTGLFFQRFLFQFTSFVVSYVHISGYYFFSTHRVHPHSQASFNSPNSMLTTLCIEMLSLLPYM